MGKLCLEKRFIFGLYTYLRQVELSVDRALYDSIAKLVIYFEDKVSPRSVLSELKSQSVEPIITEKTLSSPRRPIGLFENVVIRFLTMIGAKPYLTYDELAYIYSTLEMFRKYLTSEQLRDRKELVGLRMRLNSCGDMLALRLSRREIKRALHFEHFNQNDILDCHPLEVLVGDTWLAAKPTRNQRKGSRLVGSKVKQARVG
jgi:hypothetical protein